ncbi:MAG TPA: SDR family NAD(P)-dependent oxidoreductase [Herpetosiphonaceae bacterium]|nr:SDR family NAD(P)-dependent oxidoreductase [Herpetosiphonaceae bacterium]
MVAQPLASTALITGANSGVGFELTKHLLGQGWDVIALIRSDFPGGEPAVGAARAAGRLRVYTADLSDFAQLKRALQAIKANESRLDVLFNNAGAAIGGIASSPQGREMHYEVNTVVPYIIAMELKPLLVRGELKTIVNTSSNALLLLKAFDLDLLERPTAYKPLSGPYGASKLGLSLWTQALAPALRAEGIEIRSVNPGGNKTKMTNSAHFPLWLRPIRALFFSHPSKGAALIDDVARGSWRGTTGVFVNRGRATPTRFVQHGPAVLDKVRAIYQREFLGQAA